MESRRRLRTVLGAWALVVGLAIAFIPAVPAQADESTKVLLLLDVSGSMNERIGSGGTKFAAAKRALKKVADALPVGTQVGLRVYGSKIAEPKERNPKACRDTELVLPIGPLRRSAMYKAVDSFKAKGETPIAYSLQKSVDDLGDSGKRVVVLISDGEETCSPDPCPVAKKLATSGVALQFNAVGLAVNEKARKQLQCIAKAGDGSYYDANNTSDLEEALRRITQRALRPFQMSGTPVKATAGPDDAPRIGPGQYKDSYDPSNDPRYYRITRTPASTVTASIATIVRPYPTQNTETWHLTLSAPDGTPCATSVATSGSWRAVTVLGGSVSSSQIDSISRQPPPKVCASSPELILALSRQSPLGNDDDVAVELRTSEEPPVANEAELPEPVNNYTGKAGGVTAKPAKKLLGGSAFSNAPEIAPGTYKDSIATGETVFYRIPLQTGQRLRVTATTPAPKSSWRLGAAEALTSRLQIFSPARTQLAYTEAQLQGESSASVTTASPEVRFRNREIPPANSYLDPSATTSSIAGDYFVALQLDPLQKFLTGRVMQIRLSVAVDGKPSGQPVYGTTSPEPSPTPTTSPTDLASEPTPGSAASGSEPPDRERESGPGWIGLVGGLIGASALVAGAVAWSRRRATGSGR